MQARLHAGPQIVIHDPEVLSILNHVCVRWIVPAHPGAGDRILGIDPAAPHHPADIELVPQQPVRALGPSEDGRVEPGAAARRGYVFSIQLLGNATRAGAVGIGLEYALHDRSLDRLNCAQSAIQFPVVTQLPDDNTRKQASQLAGARRRPSSRRERFE